jgi:hypothetical protein
VWYSRHGAVMTDARSKSRGLEQLRKEFRAAVLIRGTGWLACSSGLA